MYIGSLLSTLTLFSDLREVPILVEIVNISRWVSMSCHLVTNVKTRRLEIFLVGLSHTPVRLVTPADLHVPRKLFSPSFHIHKLLCCDSSTMAGMEDAGQLCLLPLPKCTGSSELLMEPVSLPPFFCHSNNNNWFLLQDHWMPFPFYLKFTRFNLLSREWFLPCRNP